MIPSSPALVGAEKALAAEIGAETALRRSLATLEGPWHYILIDCPPTLGILATNALVAAEEVLVPVECHVMGLGGLARLMQAVDIIKVRLNSTIRFAGIVACRVDARTRHAQDVVEQLRIRFGPLVYETTIRENVRLAECPSFGQPITAYDPFCSGSADYQKLASDVRSQENRFIASTTSLA